jgi:ubiquinol-cytochrome c reductase cytochrome c subunit
MPHRRSARTAVVGAAILISAGAYLMIAPAPRATGVAAVPSAGADGQQLYTTSCASCHGAQLEGVAKRGPSLIGVGEADTWFQLTTGRMPAAREDPQPPRAAPDPRFDPHTATGRANIDALDSFVAAHGGGPALPTERGAALLDGDPVKGGKLFRLNCASCHNFTGRGGALTDRKFAPALRNADAEQIYAAMLSGPSAMPPFSDRQLTPSQKKDIIAYVLSVRGQRNAPGSLNLGEWGPVPEGFIALGVGLLTLVVITSWIGERA